MSLSLVFDLVHKTLIDCVCLCDQVGKAPKDRLCRRVRGKTAEIKEINSVFVHWD